MAMQDEKIKWVEDTPFMVDGFRFTNLRCKHYLLTHFHSDHTTGLYKSFKAGTIYTSQGTADLVTGLIGVNPERVVALPMEKPVVVAGFEITLIDANHCPAAVMFIIRDPRPGGRTALHTGDFRADKSVCANPIVRSLKGRLDCLYLDTTYCGPRHAFPDQEEVLGQAARLVRTELRRDPNTLFLVGTYSIGKERVLEAVAKAAGSRCLVTARKARILRLAGAWDDKVYTTHDAGAGGIDGEGYVRVRAVFLHASKSSTALLTALAEARAAGAPFTSVVGVRPTGWTHSNTAKEGQEIAKESARRQSLEAHRDNSEHTDHESESLAEEWNAPREPRVWGKAREYALPYSEHSSYPQLRDFVRTVKPKKIIPTVNASSHSVVEKLLRYFLEDMDLSQDRKRIHSYFCKPALKPATPPSCAPTPTAKRVRSGAACDDREDLVSSLPPVMDDRIDCKGSTSVASVAKSEKAAEPFPGNLALGIENRSPLPLQRSHAQSKLSFNGPRHPPDATPVAPRIEPPVDGSVAVDTSATGSSPLVELHLVDVEAQKAILVDIERRKRLLPEREQTTSSSRGSSAQGRASLDGKSSEVTLEKSPSSRVLGVVRIDDEDNSKADRRKGFCIDEAPGKSALSASGDCALDGGIRREARIEPSSRGTEASSIGGSGNSNGRVRSSLTAPGQPKSTAADEATAAGDKTGGLDPSMASNSCTMTIQDFFRHQSR